MALRGIQEYIARDVDNIARVKEEGNIFCCFFFFFLNIFISSKNYSCSAVISTYSKAVIYTYISFVILLASRAIYSCIPRKRAIQYYYYYLYRALCVILLSNDRG